MILYCPDFASSSAFPICPSVRELLMYAGVNAGFIEGLNLVHHQGNQGRDHHRNSRHQKCRDLIAQRFSRPGRHNGEDVFPGQDLVDNLLLPRTEGVIAEICFQSLFLLISVSFIQSVSLRSESQINKLRSVHA